MTVVDKLKKKLKKFDGEVVRSIAREATIQAIGMTAGGVVRKVLRRIWS